MSDDNLQEIDLRLYVEAVLGKWYWIMGAGLLAGVLAYLATLLLLPPIYEARALVSITELRQRVEFDPRIITVEEGQTYGAYPEIAISDELLISLRNEIPAIGSVTLQRLRSSLNASQGSDPSLLVFTAKNTNPELAASIANRWAQLFVSWANETYGDSSEEQLRFFEQRLEDAAAELEEAEGALVAYQALNRSTILQNELLALRQTHADLLAKAEEIERLLRDIESLLSTSPDNVGRGAAASDQFTALLLRLRTFGGPASETNTNPAWQLQVNSADFSAEGGQDPEEQVLLLRETLEVQADQTAAALAEIEPQLLAVQRERQEAATEESMMLRNVELATETYTALARTVEEKRITSQDTNSGFKLASRSAVPTSPVGPRKLLNTVAAATGATFLAVFVILMIAWWGPE